MAKSDFDIVADSLDYEVFWSGYFELLEDRRVQGDNFNTFCPFHSDTKTPSFSVNITTGKWRCFGCHEKGNVFQFYVKKESVTMYQALIKLAAMCVPPVPIKNKSDKPPIDPKYLEQCISSLKNDREARKDLFEKKGIEKDQVKEYQIGYDSYFKRYTFPVYKNKDLVNIRKYCLHDPGKYPKTINHNPKKPESVYKKEIEGLTEKQAKKVSEKWSYGDFMVYGYNEVMERRGEPIFVCEGETDKLLLTRMGFLAISGTAGATTFKKEYFYIFEGRDVIIVYDNDEAGRNGSRILANNIYSIAKTVKRITLPTEGTKEDNDLCDLFLKKRPEGKWTKEKFLEFCENEQVYKPKQKVIEDTLKAVSEEDIIEVSSLKDLYKSEYKGKRIALTFTITGSGDRVFDVPSFVLLNPTTCRKIGSCENASACLQGTQLTNKDREYHGACHSSDSQIETMLKRKLCIFNERGPKFNITDRKKMREYFIKDMNVPFSELEDDTANQESNKTMKLYYDGDQEVQIRSYRAEGYIQGNPKTQDVVFCSSKIESIEESWETFEVTTEVKEILSKFRKLSSREVIEDLIEHVTKIYDREKILTLMLLTYLSPIYFKFNGRRIIGIFNSIVIGDSGTGKSSVFFTLQKMIGIGTYIRGELSSRTGLIYGMFDHKSRGWEIRPGEYITNSRKLICVDEIQKIDEAEITTMNQGIDTGYTEIKRIVSNRYESLTRVIGLCNPKNSKPIMSFRRPCLSLLSIFEDTFIRRIDGFAFCSMNDIDMNLVDDNGYTITNRPAVEGKEQKVTQEMMRSLVFLMWNIKEDQIIFEEVATERCLKLAGELSMKFGHAINLKIVHSSDFRNTLAKAAVGFAALDCNFSSDYSTLIVTEDHVYSAYGFFDVSYSQENCGLQHFSIEERSKNTLTNQEYKVFVDTYNDKKVEDSSRPNSAGSMIKIIGLLKSHATINRNMIKDMINIGWDEIGEKMRFLMRFNIVEEDQRGHFKGNQKFNILIDRMIKEQVISEQEMSLSFEGSTETAF